MNSLRSRNHRAHRRTGSSPKELPRRLGAALRAVLIAGLLGGLLVLLSGSEVLAQQRPGRPDGPPGGGGAGDFGGDGGGAGTGDLGQPFAPGPTAPGGLPGRPGSGAGGRPAVAPVCPGGARALDAAEADGLARSAAQALDETRMTVAVVDRLGRPLVVYQKPGTPAADADRAVGLARTGAFFSNDQAPLSSRTVRFISGVHFPPGVERTPNAALYGIENTNRGCDLRVAFLPKQSVPPARSVVHGGPCDATCDTGCDTGCGTGPVTGKPQPGDSHGGVPVHDPAAVAVDPGGIPVYRGTSLVGGIGVYAPNAPPDHAEFAALAAAIGAAPALGPVPDPLPDPGVVFIDGVRLPFVRQVQRPAASSPDTPQVAPLVLGPTSGLCVPEGWLAGPTASPELSVTDVERIIGQAVAGAQRTRAVIRLPLGSRARMVIAVSDLKGEILGLFRMPDATVFSIDVAVAKARNVVWFSQGHLPGVPAGVAVSNRTISFGAQPLFPAGIDGTAPGPFFGLFQDDLAHPCAEGFDPASPNRNGVVFFPGSIPLYRGGQLIGGLGVSGDGVEQDDYVSFVGADGFRPPKDRWADRVKLRGVRLPFLKLPRNPEG